MKEFIEIDFISITQPLGTFYIGNIDWFHLINISPCSINELSPGHLAVGNTFTNKILSRI